MEDHILSLVNVLFLPGEEDINLGTSKISKKQNAVLVPGKRKFWRISAIQTMIKVQQRCRSSSMSTQSKELYQVYVQVLKYNLDQ